MDEPTYRTQEPRGDYGHDGTGYRFTVFGEVLHEHYQVIRKVGWDSHSTTWLAWSRHPGHPFFVHLKIYKAGLEKECNRNLEVLTFLNHSFRGCFVKPLNHFVIRSRTPSANRVVEHQCLVHEKVGESLHSHLRTKLSLTPDQVKTVAKSLLLQLQQLHSKLILHRDVNLQNLFVRHSDLESCKDALFMIFLRCKKIRCTNDKRSCGKRNAYCQRPYVKLDDLKWKLEDYKTQLLHHAEPEVDTFAVRLAGFETATGAPYVPIESPHYNCPESLLKSTFLFSSADIFSVGCIIFELLTGCELFRKEPRLGVSMEQELIVQMAELFGDIPNIFVVLCPLDKLASVFNVNFLQRFINPREKRGWTIREFFVAKVRCTVEEARSIEQLLTMMMRINPFARSTSFECLIHPWLSSPATESPVTQHASSVIPSQPEVQVATLHSTTNALFAMSTVRLEDYLDVKTSKMPVQEPAFEYHDDGTGYRFTQIGEVLTSSYRVIHKIGWNERATYWLGWRMQPEKNHSPLVAIIIYKSSEPSFFAETEISLCMNMINSPHLLYTIDAFSVGEHNCIVTEATGENVEYFLRHSGYSFEQIRRIAGEALLGLDVLQKAGFVHRNLNPESLFFVPPESTLLHHALKILVWRRDGKMLPSCVRCSAEYDAGRPNINSLNRLIAEIQSYILEIEDNPSSNIVRVKIGSFHKALGPFITPFNQKLFAGFYQPRQVESVHDDMFMLACTFAMMVRKADTASHLEEAEQLKKVLHCMVFAQRPLRTAEQCLRSTWIQGANDCFCEPNLEGGVNHQAGPSNILFDMPAPYTVIKAPVRRRRFRTASSASLRVMLAKKQYEKRLAAAALAELANETRTLFASPIDENAPVSSSPESAEGVIKFGNTSEEPICSFMEGSPTQTA